MDNCISEVFRLAGPVVATLFRECTKEFTLAGVRIPLGTQMTCPVTLSGTQKHWPDAHEFKPERFEVERGGVNRTEWSPFYQGQRKCIGYPVAELMYKMIIG